MVEELLVDLRDVTKIYTPTNGPSIRALDSVSLRIRRGEFVAIVGPSGGGKSTLMNILGLLDEPTSGEYILAGTAAKDRRGSLASAMRAKSIAFVFQAFHLLEARPATDSVELNLMYRGVSRTLRRDRARAALEAVGLANSANQRVAELSGGQRQRVAIARAIAGDADLLLADEPTGNLDSQNAARVLDELQRLHRAGATVVVVTHALEVADRADRVIRIVDGRLESDRRLQTHRPTHQEHPSTSASQLLSFTSLESATVRAHERVRLVDFLKDSWASVTSRKSQSIGQAFAVAVAVALAIATLGLSSSAAAQVASTFDAQLNREVTARWSSGTEHSPALESIPERAHTLRGVDAAAVMLSQSPAAVSTFAGSRQVQSHLAIGDFEAAARLSVTRAPWHSGDLKGDEALVGDILATQLQLGSLAGAPSVTVGSRSFVVVGLITGSPRVPTLRGEVVLGAPDTMPSAGSTDVNLLVVTQAGAAQQVARQLPAVLNPFIPDQIGVIAPTDSATLRGRIEGGLQTALTALTGVAVIVAIAALTNSTLLAVSSRRSEIGMRKALGATERQIGALIATESAYMGVAGGVVGLMAGMASVLTITLTQRWAPVFETALIPFAILLGLAVGAAGGGLAAVRAARISPAETLRD